MKKLSIIIPTLNEEAYLRMTIDHLIRQASNPDEIEILVVDAGSTDKTLNSIQDLNVRMFSKPDFVLKKYASLNFGIQKAKGSVLLFLDADTFLPLCFDDLIHQTLKNKRVVGGAFEFSFEKKDWKLSALQLINRIRYRLEQTYYGDQAVFCLKEAAEMAGGYPNKILMESAYFCSELKKNGKLKLIKTPVITSPRRFNENGFFKVTWFDFSMWVRFVLNLSVEEYGLRYWGLNAKRND